LRLRFPSSPRPRVLRAINAAKPYFRHASFVVRPASCSFPKVRYCVVADQDCFAGISSEQSREGSMVAISIPLRLPINTALPLGRTARIFPFVSSVNCVANTTLFWEPTKLISKTSTRAVQGTAPTRCASKASSLHTLLKRMRRTLLQTKCFAGFDLRQAV